MVEDPLLSKHLSYWGIDMLVMEKSEKTIAEMQIDLNLKHEFDKITEKGSILQPMSGPGFVGLSNLGNSCYMNSVMQLICRTSFLQSHYANEAENIFVNSNGEIHGNLVIQTAKLANALANAKGLPSNLEEGSTFVNPKIFKMVIGQNHPEFSTSRQQDAVEFFQYYLDQASRAERRASEWFKANHSGITSTFEFMFEDRIECSESSKVTYKCRKDNVLALDIPLDDAINKDEIRKYEERQQKRQKLKLGNGDAYVDENGETILATDADDVPVIPKVPFKACLSTFAAEEKINDFFSSALQKKVVAKKTMRFKTFPPYLICYFRRYYIDSSWRPCKLEVSIDIPDEISLEHLRSSGLQDTEEELPADGEQSVVADPQIVSQLMGMGFSENGSTRAAIAMNNESMEACLEWVFQHMEDANFNEPIPKDDGKTNNNGECYDPELLSTLTAMGFSSEQCKAAIHACKGDVERAADWLFSHADELDAAVSNVLGSVDQEKGDKEDSLQDGKGEYCLTGIISHIGKNTACGHYVAHLKEGDKWYIFNDEKVALSERPPLDFAYMALLKRKSFV